MIATTARSFLPVDLAGRKVLVTAAGSGIGHVIAEAFLARGASVWICDIDAAAIGSARETLKGVRSSVIDVSKPDKVAELFAHIRAAFGGLDVLVNNAGVAGPTAKVEDVTTRLARGIPEAHGLTAIVDYDRSYPPTINNADEAQFVADTIADLYGAERFEPLANPIPGAEDFSRILEEIPGAYVFLGVDATGDHETAPSNHATGARFDDQWLADGAALLAELAVRRMARG